MKQFIFVFFLCLFSVTASAEDGSRLWLRMQDGCGAQVTMEKESSGKTVSLAVHELQEHWKGVPIRLQLNKKLHFLKDGYRITGNKQEITVSAFSEAGLLYGAFHLLRLQESSSDRSSINVEEIPSYDIRVLNHWDNLDGTVERGYAGRSIWKWNELPGKVSSRYHEYARANASIGINGTVLNNVNADPLMLSGKMLEKVKIIADELRPYHIRVYLSVNFSSPKVLGGLPTSDPMDVRVRDWWKEKVNEIYRLIPDFGGFLVKANSEGLPGPQDFGWTHADGANMLADALKPHKGIVMWRAFVYNPDGEDRAKQAYKEFTPLDGQFKENVIIQVKNGPIDFQPREPFNPLFGTMEKTSVMPEFQITQEYLGFSNHLVFLAPQWKEFFESDTYSKGKGSSIAKVTDGTMYTHPLSAIAGVANIGEDDNWCGHHFAQANWYAFGRLAWNHSLAPETIAGEWIKMTFSDNTELTARLGKMMLDTYDAAVDYMMPLGLHHIFAWNHHYGPEPWCDIPGARPDWLPKYYHQADEIGIGFDRTENGSHAVSQYHFPLRDEFNNIQTCPEKYLLWFHHVSWNYRLKDGQTCWDKLCYEYDSGVRQVREFQKVWDSLEKYVDVRRFREVQSKLRIQSRDAVWWKDACLLYFQLFSEMPIPYDIERPVHDLDDLMKVKLDLKHHN